MLFHYKEIHDALQLEATCGQHEMGIDSLAGRSATTNRHPDLVVRWPITFNLKLSCSEAA